MAASFSSSARLAIQDGVGIVGYTVFDADGTQIAARSTSGVTRLSAGSDWSIYQTLITVPSGVTAGTVIWDDNNGNPADRPFFIGIANQGDVTTGDYDSTLDATWGGTGADSYLSLADAEDLIQKFIWETSAWGSSSGQKKDSLLRTATRRIDLQNYYGRRVSYLQMLEFPRIIDNSFLVRRTLEQIEEDVKLATIFEAIDLVNKPMNDRHAQNIAAGLKQVSESVGPIRDQYTYTGGPSTLLCRTATQILDRYRAPRQLYRS